MDVNFEIEKEVKYKHHAAFMLLIILTVLGFAATCGFNAVSNGPNALFLNNTGDVSDAYYLEITPAGWTFSIWGIIYFWQVCFLIYALVSLCRKGPKGYLYVNPGLLPAGTFIFYIVNNLCNISWLFLWDRQILWGALIVIALMPFTLWVALVFCHLRLDSIAYQLIGMNSGKDIWLIRFLVQNAMAFYATWVTIATLLNLSMVLSYVTKAVTQDVACTIALGILSAEITTWFILETFVLDRYVRYTFAPYPVIIMALIGSMSKNWDPTKRNSIFTAVLLGIAGVLTIVKVSVIIYRHIKRPLYQKVEPITSKPF
ncbi:uncharacterized protein LOC106175794 [Lingula anatina]|uniref:Uncharacterized protein LOC106175794 n=1 Tax=Lingula anatina TaxID=7574 RepID=A0A1S3JSP8_LINAN|nr:uncharacterized protein LOC106175794 [Lingula anatina]|eukprot:XP_013413395.1 uncharacterized protein LOC106175794 [Lingula anatina]